MKTPWCPENLPERLCGDCGGVFDPDPDYAGRWVCPQCLLAWCFAPTRRTSNEEIHLLAPGNGWHVWCPICDTTRPASDDEVAAAQGAMYAHGDDAQADDASFVALPEPPPRDALPRLSVRPLVATFTLGEAALYLHMHPEELRARAKRGDLPGAKTGRRWVFLETDLADYVRSRYPARRQALRVTSGKESVCHYEPPRVLRRLLRLRMEPRCGSPRSFRPR